MPFDERSMYGSDEPSSQERSTPEHEDKEHEEGNTVLVNDTIHPGLKPGDPLSLRVVETRDKEYVCEYEKEEGEHDKGGAREGDEAPMPGGGDREMASMME